MATVFSANVSKVTIDENDAPGLQAIEYKVVRNRQNIHNIGQDERVGVLYGPMYVIGSLRFRSTCPYLDDLVEQEIERKEKGTAKFQIVVTFRSEGEDKTRLAFDECTVEEKSFSIDANGIGVTDYTFTAVRVREGT